MKILHHSILFAILSSLLFIGCTKEIAMDEMPEGVSDYIHFTVDLHDAISASAVTRSGNLSIEAEDWPLEPKTVTRAAPYTSFPADAGLIGYNFNAGDFESTLPWDEMYDETYNFNYLTLTSATTAVPWVRATGKSYLRVYAYAPKSFSGSATLSGDDVTGAPTLTYTVPSDVSSQTDLIAAVSDDKLCSEKTSVPLTFNHALSAIRFNIGFTCTVKSVCVKNVLSRGTYTIGGSWSGQDTPDNYTITFGEGGSGVSLEAGANLTDGDNTFMFLPQTLPADAQVVLTYKKADDPDWQTLTYDIEGKPSAWEQGRRYTYTLYEGDIKYIYFDLAAGNVTIINGTYTGYVYQNAGASSYQVTGTHNANNKYYIYQSTDSNKSSYGYLGDGGTSTWRNPPVYSEVQHGGVPWRQYITNNTNSLAVTNDWVTDAGNVGRTSTPNWIKIEGNMLVDMTIDNLWSSFELSYDHRTSGALLIGPGVNTSNTRVAAYNTPRYERVILRLKGDNRLCNIMYYGHPSYQTEANTAFFKITSAEGDGSENGSLTVAREDLRLPLSGACTIMGSGDNDECPPCNDMIFNGGTVYVATPIRIPDSNACSALGGGTNNSCNLVFNGGTVTSVAYSTGAAIGGGGGFQANGGDGTVTINGGRVYAYQFGTFSNSRGQKLPTAAIGGGSSYVSTGNLANVTITGGEVFARSVGGAAIGGGSSASVYGGSATINISGGTIVAQSVSGTLEQTINPTYTGGDGISIAAAGSIGGGRGGIYGSGGSANFTISGGTLLAGSIGGGQTIAENQETYKVGSATINISGTASVQGQFIMAAGSAIAPSFTMTGGTIQNGLSTDPSFVILYADGGAVHMEAGTFTMSNGTITGSTGNRGGAVYLASGTVDISGGTIEHCSSTQQGGAIYLGGGSMSMTGGTIRNCLSNLDGGAIYLTGGSMTMSGGHIQGNSSSSSGAGIAITGGNFTMPYEGTGEITDNHATDNGGGVYVTSLDGSSSATISIIDGSITSNTAAGRGGGLYVHPSHDGSSATIYIKNSEHPGTDSDTNPAITGNRAGVSGGGLYAQGPSTHLNIYGGKIQDNTTTAYVPNGNISLEGGTVKLHQGNVPYVTVFFDKNDDTSYPAVYDPVHGNPQKIVTATNSLLELPVDGSDNIVVPTRNGYAFGGWYDNPAGTGSPYTQGQVMNISTNITLYAKWTPQ